MPDKIIDLRSDTVTRPTPAMLEAMFSAQVGDDVFDEDPTVKELEAKAAKMFGKEAGLFCPSGTMTNQIAHRILTQPQEEIICDKGAHIYYYEGGGIASNSGASLRLVDGDRGRITAQQVIDNINPPENIHQPYTSLVSIENTSNKGGGSYYTLKQMQEIESVSRKNNLKMHLDGARIFNAIAETGDSTLEIGKLFDTISICLSKGLGAPVGSLILADKEKIVKAKRVRKGFGGGMRQSGYLAAAGIYALDNNLKRLKEDHKRAKTIFETLKSFPWVKDSLPVDTNIVVFTLADEKPSAKFLSYLSEKNIKAVPFGKQVIRMVTHLDVDDDDIGRVVDALRTF